MSVQTLVNIASALDVSVECLLNDTEELQTDKISEQISQNLSDLNDDEKLYFLNMIRQYKTLNKN